MSSLIQLSRTAVATGVGVVLVIMIIAGVVLVPRWLGDRSGEVVVGPPERPATGYTDPAPKGWRTEQYRGITVQVPADWAYAFEPGSSWCAGQGAGAAPDDVDPYVALGNPQNVPAIACPPVPDRLVTEHLQVTVVADPQAGDARVNGHWVITRVVDDVQVTAVSQDQALARRMADSAAVATGAEPCAATMAISTDDRPEPAFAVERLAVTGAGMVCQYEDPTGRSAVAHLRARVPLPADRLTELTGEIGAAAAVPACPSTIVGLQTEIVLSVWIPTSSGVRTLAVRAGSCGDEASTTFGGYDDGTTVHRLTRSSCQVIMAGPVETMSGSGDVAEACMPA